MARLLLIQSTAGVTVAEVRATATGRFYIQTDDDAARDAIETLIGRGRKTGLLHNHDHRQRTDRGEVFRMYGQWSKPGDPDFLDALADALLEFDFLAHTVELVKS